MPIGVPRIIYCWGEELPAQWTDIYNFIFRRRMVFLMQYLDDELCNQICGLLINIHMEDRSKEMEKKEMENSGLFKSPSVQRKSDVSSSGSPTNAQYFGNKKERSIEDLMISSEDLAIDENYSLERNTLQKISLEWLNWNAQFFDYSEEPYLFYLAELLAKDATGDTANLLYNSSLDQNPDFSNSLGAQNSSPNNMAKLMMMFKNMKNSGKNLDSLLSSRNSDKDYSSMEHFDVYSPFRLLTSFSSMAESSQDSKDFIFDAETKNRYAQKFKQLQKARKNESSVSTVVSDLAQRDFFDSMEQKEAQLNFAKKAKTQRQLRRDYSGENNFVSKTRKTPASYLQLDYSDDASNYFRKQTERALQEEESKKVFMIINSFGGSVGNGITVHDALQFIKAGSMTLALGVAASAASLALAGGTIGERYVTEGCHVMIHQPEGGLTGQASDIWIDSQEIMKIRLDVAEIYSLSTYRPRHKILRDLDRDFYLTAMETIYYGLADEIATNEVMHEIIEMTSKVWDYHDTQQQRLLETRDSATSGLDTQTQN